METQTSHEHHSPDDHIHPPPSSFLSKYVFSHDHKVIGLQFLVVSAWFMAMGGMLAMLLRWQLAYPFEEPTFGPLRWLFKIVYKIAEGQPVKMPPEIFPSLTTMHGTIMIFFVVIPLLVGFFGNYLIPLQIGARDMAFPTLNMLSFWCSVPAGLFITLSLLSKDGPAGAGWTSYPPLSVLSQATPSSGDGQTYWILAVILVGTSSIMGGINYMTTIINLRAPGMNMFKMPLSVWSMFITSFLQVLATPVLAAAMIMLLMDKTLHTSFFLSSDIAFKGTKIAQTGGGSALLFQHVFWFYSHPAVYILVLPGMGLVSDIMPTFSRKPIFGYKAMAYSMAGISLLGFVVWAHHMFQAGINPTVATGFMLSTMVIAVPSSVKVFNWLGSIWGGSLRFTTPMLFALGFISMFIIGGLSGVFLASTPVDIFLHDTYYVVAHFHYVVFGGSLFAVFGGLHYWWPKITGRMMNETIGKLHFWLTFIGFNGAFFPMHILGMGGMMRRIADPMEYLHLQPLQPMNQFVTYFALLLGAAQFLFLFNLLSSLVIGPKAGNNPWNATGLPWTISSPPPYYNYEKIPTVYHGPYEFSVPGMDEDFLMQTDKQQPAGLEGH